MSILMERAGQLESKGIFLGGPVELFELAGQKVLMALLSEGLTPHATVLDVGCGCLRGGYWLIHFLDQGCYYGIEPNAAMLQAGIDILLEPAEKSFKAPRFDHNPNFDFEVFGQRFDFLVARSIWTHASRAQIKLMLDGFVKTASPDGVFLTSYMRAGLFTKGYMGDHWVGKSHESDVSGIVRHSFGWIRVECSKRGLTVREMKDPLCNFGNQTWLVIRRKNY